MLLNGISRLTVGGAFVFAGSLKLKDPARFALDVSHFRLLPNELINPVALLLPGIECVAGLLVLSGVWLRASALVVTGLTGIFMAAIVTALARGLNIECGCFGTMGGRHVGLVSLAIDITLFSMAFWLAKTSKDTPWNNNFREAGAQVSATPLEASPKASAAGGGMSL
jgi:uncharacterized membrane protein YphA (DoxX/SURF4 family)